MRDLSPRWQAAGSRCIQPSRVLQDLVHSRRAGSRGDCLKRELEQRAGEGPLRCCGNDAAPAGHVGCTQGRADGSVRARSVRLCKEPQEGRGFRAPAATNLDGENHKVAALRARQLGVVATLAPCCELKREAGSGVGALPRLARASDGAHASGVDGKLRPVPKGQAVAHYLDPSCIGYRDREIHVGKAHVAGDSCPSLLADPGDRSLCLLDTYNRMLVEESSEPSWRHTLFKMFPRPGDSTQANNWRTIAVRKITYKGFAKLLGARNSDGLESAQCADQVGFRSKLENSFRRTVLQTPERGPSAANYWARPGLEPHPPHLTLPKLTTGRRRVAAPQTSQRERHSGEAARRQGWQCWTWEMTASWLRRNAQLRQEKPRITQTTVPCACCLGDKIGTCLCGSLAQIHVVEFN